MREITVRFEREQVDVTYGGFFGGEPDYERKFIPGPTTVYVTVDGVELPPMTPDEYEAWDEVNRLQ